jgi:hypothetical protein
MANKKLTAGLTVLAFIVPPLIMIGVIIYNTYSRNILIAEYNIQTKALVKKWTNYNYIPITYDDSSFPDHMKKLVVDSTTESELTKEQKARLILEELIFTRAYSQGTYNAYRAFRIPSGVSFTLTNSQFGSINMVLIDGFKLPGILSSNSISMDKKFEAYLVANNRNGTVYSNYFTSICFDQSTITITQYKNSIPDAGASSLLPKDFPKLAGEYGELFGIPNFVSQKEYTTFIRLNGGTLEEVEKQFGSVMVADSYFFIKCRDSGLILPIVLRVYWDPNIGRWLPDDIALWGGLFGGGHLLPIF